jgi:uroporphyrinogen-III synthase
MRMIWVEQHMQALVTRPREESESLAAALATRGIGAVIEPLMQVQYRPQEAVDLTDVQAILCTSANGVRALARASGERGLPLFAVGDATASRARAEGFIAVESAGGNVVDLGRLAAGRLCPENGRLLHVAGDVVAGDLAGALRAHGFTIDRRVLYEARPVTELSPAAVHALRSGVIDFALFFSPRTAAVFAGLAVIACVAECCATITALSISPAADAALADLPWRDRRIAERPNQAGLLETLDRILGERLQD